MLKSIVGRVTKMRFPLKTIALATLLAAGTVYSAVETNNVQEGGVENIVEMKKRLNEQNKLIVSLTKEVSEVDVSLGLNNKKYLKLAEERARLEEALTNAKKNADLDNESLKKSYTQTKNLLMAALLNKLENTENPSALLSRKILIDNLQRRLSDLAGVMKENKGVRDDVEALQEKLQNSMETEKDLLAVMNELEQRKRELRTELERQGQEKNATQSKFDEVKNKLAMTRMSTQKAKQREQLAPLQITEEIKIPSQPLSGETFYPPIYAHQGIEYKKAGVTFNFQGKNEVRATRAGKIAHTGPLGSYGNVVIIDHGNETRTILLGQFDASVNVGDNVKETQVVGHTKPSSGALGDGRIYFEVRKKNLAQNTYLLLDKKSLGKTSSN